MQRMAKGGRGQAVELTWMMMFVLRMMMILIMMMIMMIMMMMIMIDDDDDNPVLECFGSSKAEAA